MSLHVQKLIRLLIIALYSATVFALKEALAILPNIEVVTFLLSFAALSFPLPMSLPIPIIFSLCEILLRGIASWVILYLTAWPLLVLLIWLLKKTIKKHWWILIILNGIWGWVFGTLDAFIHLLLFDKSTFLLYWINGFVFYTIHSISNAVVAGVLYKPVMYLWENRLKYYIISVPDPKELNNLKENQPTVPLNGG